MANTNNLVAQFVVPPLGEHDHIEDWMPLFKASVTPLLARDNGEKLAIGLLPGHVNHRTAEVELVREAITKDTLDSAFTLLCTLDDPIDPYEAMRKLCRTDWLHGVRIDDFFYQLKKQSKHANASLQLICTIIIGQLPKKIQGKAR